MSGFNEQDLIQFWKDANSYQSIDVACFNIDEFKDNWIRDKIGYEALEKANGATTGEKQCNLPVVSASTTIKELHESLTNLLQAADDEGWNCDGKDWEEQEQARKALANTPSEYLR